MDEVKNLVYFLNLVKDSLPFKNENDFRKKIKENKDFRIKVQKLVYLSKFFGWENPYMFTLAERGPYSVELKQTYLKETLFDEVPLKIDGFRDVDFFKFFNNKDILYLEAASTILYALGANFLDVDKNECISLIRNLKNHIPSNIIEDAFNNIKTFKLYGASPLVTKEDVDNLESEVGFKIKCFTQHFEEYEISRNKIIVLGSMDYMRITLRESNLNLNDKYDLLMFTKRFLSFIEKIAHEVNPCDLIDLDFNDLEELFDQFQDYVSGELKIIKRIDDDEFDESLFY